MISLPTLHHRPWMWVALLLIMINVIVLIVFIKSSRSPAKNEIMASLPSSLAVNEPYINVIHRGEQLPKNWLVIVQGKTMAMATLMAEPFWQKTLLCVQWPLPTTADTRYFQGREDQNDPPITPNLAPWSNWLSSPSVAAMLFAWQSRINEVSEGSSSLNSLPSWYSLTIKQELIQGEISAPSSHVWRFPLDLWKKLVERSQEDLPPILSTNIPNTLVFWFAQANEAESAQRALMTWQNDEDAQGLMLSASPPPRLSAIRHWYPRSFAKRYAEQFAAYPFWRQRKLCE